MWNVYLCGWVYRGEVSFLFPSKWLVMLYQYCSRSSMNVGLGNVASTEFYVYLYLAFWLVIYVLCFFFLYGPLKQSKAKQNIFVVFLLN